MTHGSHEAEYQLSLQQTDGVARKHWLTLAAEGGITKASFELAQLQQEQGELEQARASYAKAAGQGHTQAQYAYGEMLRQGLGGKEDYVLALKQYRLAAQQGDRMAQYRMGTMREEGLGLRATGYMPMPGYLWRQQKGCQKPCRLVMSWKLR